MSVKKTDKQKSGKQLVKRTTVEGTPFVIISEKGKGHYIVMGNHRLTEASETIEEQMDIIEKKEWNFMTVVIGTIISVWEDVKEFNKVENNK